MPGVLVFPALKSLLLLGLAFSSVFALSWARFLPGLRAIFSLQLDRFLLASTYNGV